MLVSISPLFSPLFQVSAGPAGEVVFTACACLALAERNDDGGRVVCPMIVGPHLTIADGRPNHVGYATSDDPLPWVEPCKARRAELTRKAEEEAKNNTPKLWTPDKPVIGEFKPN